MPPEPYSCGQRPQDCCPTGLIWRCGGNRSRSEGACADLVRQFAQIGCSEWNRHAGLPQRRIYGSFQENNGRRMRLGIRLGPPTQ
jgi:hypothetical protein